MLRIGAAPLTSAADVLELFGLDEPAPSPPDAEAAVLLERLPATADELARATGLDAGSLAASLAELELAGLVVEAEGTYRAAR